MKNKYDNFDILTDFDNLYKAYMLCARGVRWKDGTIRFSSRAYECVLYLKNHLIDGTFITKPRREFYVYEPKKRRIIASEFAEKVVQRCLCDNIIKPVLFPKVIYGNYASQQGKGQHFGLNHLKSCLRRYYQKNGIEGYILKGDIRHYFPTMEHEQIKAMFREHFEDERILKVIDMTIDSWCDPEESTDEVKRGMALGFDLSQICGVFQLNKLDHYLLEERKVHFYGRYMDDFFVIARTKEELRDIKNDIDKRLSEYGHCLNKKTHIFPIRQGLDYLGFHTYITESGKVVMKLRQKSKNKQRRKLRKLKDFIKEGRLTFDDVWSSYQSWRAHAMNGNTYYLVLNMDKYFDELFKEYLEGTDKGFMNKPKTKKGKRKCRKHYHSFQQGQKSEIQTQNSTTQQSPGWSSNTDMMEQG